MELIPYARHYREEAFWPKLRSTLRRLGKQSLERALWFFYAYLDPNTPAWAKAVILGWLGYFILPLDLVFDLLPGLGYKDDLLLLGKAIAAVGMHITPEAKAKARTTLKRLLGS